ncbi:hypothetical protein C84B14_06186 [Salinisphaera sp. C84B14]|uniref:hypothetical protein n=1 Tax=Salinisphaera sp. C84B14 TaxID=1304155 RepID=UPI003340ABB5
MKRSLVFAGIALPVIACAGAAGWFANNGLTGTDAFDAAAGSNTTYVVGHRVTEHRLDTHSFDRWVKAIGVLRYRLEDFGDSRQLHVEPLLTEIHGDDQKAMARITYEGDLARRVGGFDMPIENGRPTFDHAAAAARTSLGDELDAPAGNPLVAPIVVPTLPRSIEAREGAEYTLATWRGLSDIRFRVEAIDDDTLSLRIESTDTTRALDADVQPADVRLLGRMRIRRADGWLDALTLVRRDVVERDAGPVAIDRVTRAYRKIDLLSGNGDDKLAPFFGATDSNRREIEFAQAPDDIARPAPAISNPSLADYDTALSVDLLGLILHIRYNKNERVPALSLGIRDVTFYDADDNALDVPAVLYADSPFFDYETFDDGQMFIYVPLGGDRSVLERIARAEATLIYHEQKPHYFTLRLDDQPHTLEHAGAQLQATPDPAHAHRWRLRADNTADTRYYTSRHAIAPGVTGAYDLALDDSWLSVGEATLLSRVDGLGRDVSSIRINADRSPVDLPLVRLTNGKRHEYRVEFKRSTSP